MMLTIPSSGAFVSNGGLSVEQDEKAAFRWYMKAADAGQCLAFAALSRCYSEGIAVPVDLHTASVYKKKYHEASTGTYETMGIIDVFDPTNFEETIYTKRVFRNSQYVPMVRISAVHYEHYGLDLPPPTTFLGANQTALRNALFRYMSGL